MQHQHDEYTDSEKCIGLRAIVFAAQLVSQAARKTGYISAIAYNGHRQKYL